MSAAIARHHAEWLSLIDISGPFLSVEVLTTALPQGLDARDPALAAELRAAHEEWSDEQMRARPDRAIHGAWVDYVLSTALELPDSVIARGQAIPTGLQFSVPEYGETIRPDIVVHNLDRPGEPRMLVQVYPAGQNLESEVKEARWKVSPAQRMQELLGRTDLRLGLVTNGDQWMLVNAKRNETTGFITWEADLWTQEPLCLRSFRTLFSAHRFFMPEDQRLETWLDDSANDQAEVTNQLGYQVRRAVEIIVQTIDRLDAESGRELLDGVEEDELYQAALTVMMRLVFLMSAEDRDLMPMDNPLYAQHYAVSPLRGQLREAADQVSEAVVERRHDAWSRLLATFRAVHGGVEHEDMKLPAYGGSLFDPDRFPFLEGRAPGTHWRDSDAEPLKIDNRTVLHLLEALQLLQVRFGGQTETRRLSFRALDIEQIGHVYEGLLDHQATRAEGVILGLKGKKGEEPEVALVDLQAQMLKDSDGSYEDLVAFLRKESGRSPTAIRKEIDGGEIDGQRASRLLEACHNDEDLYHQVESFANLIRADHLGDPVVIPAGSVYVTAGTTRRATGTHYTPKSLTEPIVQHTLEPLVYIGPAEGHPRDKWKLKRPAELLDLKICDMAMGSGAFLVQVVRYLSERLVEAWSALSEDPRVVPEFTVEGAPPTGRLGEIHIPRDPDERIVLARRLIADRCIYGVDKNPLAVEMAKLSLWLITLEQNRAFTFLDHSLKCGDSLVGVDLDQLRNWSLEVSDKPILVMLGAIRIREQIQEVIKLRGQLESFIVKDIRDQQEKARLHHDADARINDLRAAANLLLASYFNDYKKERREAMRGHLLDVVQRGENVPADYYGPVEAVEGVRPFHWQLEFPEVFLNGRDGFDGFVGNPPFLGGTRISTMHGEQYADILKYMFPTSVSRTDLCALFFISAFNLIRNSGSFGLIATNTISQGDTREASLDYIIANDGVIYRATASMTWPGNAAVFVSVLTIYRGKFNGRIALDEKRVAYISAFLDESKILGDPYKLLNNSGEGFIGSYVLGKGFLLTPKEAESLLAKDVANRDVLFPYLNGRDINRHPEQVPSRWVIQFDERLAEQAMEYETVWEIALERIKPERMTKNEKKYPRMVQEWWKHWNNRQELYSAIAEMDKVLVRPRVSNTHAPVLVSTKAIISDAVVIFTFDDFGTFSLLQANIHESWVRLYASTLKGDTRYSPTDVFDNFPFPHTTTPLEAIGETYHETRRQIMLERWKGLTATYNRFHEPDETAADIQQLRDLHVEMDQQVAAAYGWDDLALEHGYHDTAQGLRFTISEAARREVLTRLLKLNHERFAEECRRGLHTTKKGKKACAEFFAKHPHMLAASQSAPASATINLRGKIRPFNDSDQELLL
ncbi:MAG: restriction endonuclease [Chloroflexi bacterium]|nr:restriction endonuclease [Chloroflexota bacterium]